MTDHPVLFLTAEERGRALVARWRGATPLFCCVLAHTDLCLVPGLSAAGATPELRLLTPAADGEAVVHGVPRCLPSLPTNPLGPPGPVGITRAAIELAGMPVALIGAGLRVWPDAPIQRVECEPAGRIDLAPALSCTTVQRLFQTGMELGASLAANHPYVILAESVPGGTTTALALLEALGIPSFGRVSGSLADNAHALKGQIVATALRRAHLGSGDGRSDPLAAVAEVGDPMQPLVAGLIVGAAAVHTPVLLAGGSQMVAVAALVHALADADPLEHVAIGTTPWVVNDPAADVPGLCRDVSTTLPLLAANLNFSTSRHPGLRAYEQFLVKEGVGAGGATIGAQLATACSNEHLMAAIDTAYDRLLAPA